MSKVIVIHEGGMYVGKILEDDGDHCLVRYKRGEGLYIKTYIKKEQVGKNVRQLMLKNGMPFNLY